jgi:activator of 2-hydroxyglutaryl-CoA dehydratase
MLAQVRGLSRFGTTTRLLFSMKILTRIVFLGSLFLVPALLHAQDSCVDSPECPTAILGVVGAAGAALYVRWRSR